MKISLSENQRTFLISAVNTQDYHSDKWEMSNHMLYRMCREYPGHSDPKIIADKLMVIGRVYAASLERHSGKAKEDSAEKFYFSVTPIIAEDCKRINLDARLKYLNGLGVLDLEDAREALFLHKQFADILKKHQKDEHFPRSLVSKYLHFHCPGAFYIYDDRAQKAINKLVPLSNSKVDTATVARYTDQNNVDTVYARHYVRARMFNEYLNEHKDEFLNEIGREILQKKPDGILMLAPRQLDDMLLFNSDT